MYEKIKQRYDQLDAHFNANRGTYIMVSYALIFAAFLMGRCTAEHDLKQPKALEQKVEVVGQPPRDTLESKQ